MLSLLRGRYRARTAETPGDLAAAQALRAVCFRGPGAALDADGFDARCTHVLIEDTATGDLVCCYRLMVLDDGSAIARSYSAQFYDLSALEPFAAPMAEIGRFCVAPDRRDPDILRLAWGAITALVDRQGIQMLFGCSSFRGTDTAPYLDALAQLAAGHLAPRCWRPRVKAPDVFRYARRLARMTPDPRRAAQAMPPLLRTYLLMGGWVSDHAVIDHDMGTLHVFTGLEIGAIPPARARLLRAVAG